jgi:plastocyanin
MIAWLLAMTITAEGMVMNANSDVLPRGCIEISREHEFRVEGGRPLASQPGAMFGFSQHEFRVAPCSRVTVTFVNRDTIRHQWMVHGLPRYLYPGGMFHLEANGGAEISGVFIVPPDDRTYLVHCDMAQHMEKGMKGQLIVGEGSGDLWSVAGVSEPFIRDDYLPTQWRSLGLLILGLGVLLGWVLSRRSGARD